MNCPECDKPLKEYEKGSGRLHCENDQCTFIYRDTNAKLEYRKPKDGESIYETERRYE